TPSYNLTLFHLKKSRPSQAHSSSLQMKGGGLSKRSGDKTEGLIYKLTTKNYHLNFLDITIIFIIL
ncbi:MAG TPA: hypothetical protein VKZ45_03780, partial [Vicingaceae bacterium]|nr:hypothetical protein [Vicingaceae bacterium]